MTANLAAAAKVFEGAGARLVPMTLPAPLVRYRSAAAVINWSESYAIHEHDFHAAGHKMGRALSDKMMAGFSGARRRLHRRATRAAAADGGQRPA